MHKLLITLICLVSISFISKTSEAHCEVPCGIYNDSVRVKLIYEHIATIEKAMTQLNEMNMAPVQVGKSSIKLNKKVNYNQIVRWVNNKEIHAEKIQGIVGQYFLHQRIKPVDQSDRHGYGHYVQKLELLHRISVLAMKAKQTNDLKYITMLRATVAQFEKAYFTHTH